MLQEQHVLSLSFGSCSSTSSLPCEALLYMHSTWWSISTVTMTFHSVYIACLCIKGLIYDLWWFVHAWPRQWHHYKVWACWTRCVTVGVVFKTLILNAWQQYCASSLQMKILNSQLLLHHSCLDVAMFPPWWQWIEYIWTWKLAPMKCYPL